MEHLTTGDVARHFRLPVWKVRRAMDRYFSGEARRVGPYRVFLPSDLEKIRAALVTAGYLSPAEVVNA